MVKTRKPIPVIFCFILMGLAVIGVKAWPEAHRWVRDHRPAGSTRAEKPHLEVIAVPIADGPFQPTWRSLGDGFKTPAWWNHAKIGMWLHWGPSTVPRDGDWYAKRLYMPKYSGSTDYADHLAQYGPPSVTGYKDLLPLWHAEKWDPDKLMALYRRAGARYVLAQGMHHDNFDLWDSKYQPWNSVRIGPHRSIVGDWKKAADKQGMRFGIAFHGDYALWWFQPAFLSDLDGPLKGVSYDAAQDYTGKETWWKKMGLDLKDLYGIDLKDEITVPATWKDGLTAYRMSDQMSHGIPEGDLKHHRDFAVWFATKWTRRVIDAIDQFSPDFIYFDGAGYPFGGTGTGRGLRADATPRVIAHLYNTSAGRHGGVSQAMAFTKGNDDPRAIAVNVESDIPPGIKRDQPWQTENAVGEWLYKSGTFYDTGMVIHEMLEAVSRNGNYLINLPLTPEGELDPGGVKTLEEMGAWMDVNGEGIYDSEAWTVWGEGSVVVKFGNLRAEQAATPYTARDIRFTTKAGAVYAYLMAWPKDGTVTIRSLASGAGKVTSVTLLGDPHPLRWRQMEGGLIVDLPAVKPGSFAYGLKVIGERLQAVAMAGP